MGVNSHRRAVRKLLRIVRQFVERLAFHHYCTAKLYYRIWLRLSPPKNPLLIYTMGKVGSTAVSESLLATDTDYSIQHLHLLVPGRMQADARLYEARMATHRGTALARRLRPTYLWRGDYFNQRVNTLQEDGSKWPVITLVREPVSRNTSSFFQNMELFFGYDYRSELLAKSEDEVVSDLVKLFTDSYLSDSSIYRMDADPRTWLDEELGTVFGLDVYEKPFPKSEGYEIYDTQHARVLLMRLEDLNTIAPDALRKFIGLENFQLQRANVGKDKDYSTIYKRFVNAIHFPESYVDSLYDSRYSRHFYTAEELSSFRSRWLTS